MKSSEIFMQEGIYLIDEGNLISFFFLRSYIVYFLGALYLMRLFDQRNFKKL